MTAAEKLILAGLERVEAAVVAVDAKADKVFEQLADARVEIAANTSHRKAAKHAAMQPESRWEKLAGRMAVPAVASAAMGMFALGSYSSDEQMDEIVAAAHATALAAIEARSPAPPPRGESQAEIDRAVDAAERVVGGVQDVWP